VLKRHKVDVKVFKAPKSGYVFSMTDENESNPESSTEDSTNL